MTDSRWDRLCSLSGCPRKSRPHHHHVEYGHLSTEPCTCDSIGQPGTKG